MKCKGYYALFSFLFLSLSSPTVGSCCLCVASFCREKGGKVLQFTQSELLASPFPSPASLSFSGAHILLTLCITNLFWRNIGKKLNSQAVLANCFDKEAESE